MFNNPFPNAFGLDIGDLSIKLVQLENRSFGLRRANYRVVDTRSINLPPGLIVNGEIEKPEEVRKRIIYLLNKKINKKIIKSPWVVASLPESKSFIKLIKTDLSPDNLLPEDIRDMAKKHIPYDNEEDYYIEWQIMPNLDNSKKTRILIGAIPKKIADIYTYLLESVGLGVIALEIEALAIARSMITANKEYTNEARIILDLGATRSSLIVFDQDIIQFSTSIPFSGEIITTALSQELHISHEEAEKIKISQGLGYKRRSNRAWHIMSKMTDDLVTNIKNVINFYYSYFPDNNRVTHITMCGGGSNLNKLPEILSKKLGIECRPGRSWKNLNSKKPIKMSQSESLSYSTAIGLALRAADNPFLTHDTI